MAVAIDERSEIVERVPGEIEPSVLLEPEHDEVAVPVVDLAEPPAWDDIGPAQGQQRGKRVDLLRFAPQRLPRIADVRTHVPIRRWAERAEAAQRRRRFSDQERGPPSRPRDRDRRKRRRAAEATRPGAFPRLGPPRGKERGARGIALGGAT